MKKVLVVIGTRPNFIKVTQFKKEAQKNPNLDMKIVHTGQHFDSKMTDVFFEQFNLIPDYFLDIAKNTSANGQIADIMVKLENLINAVFRPDLLVVVGDVNSTLAAAVTANKMNVKIAHLESGLRSFDKTMPEEHNRIITDRISDFFFITEQSGWDNLKKEGVEEERMFFVGNTMIDTLIAFSDEIEKSPVLQEKQLNKDNYVLITMHRPATVDNKDGLLKLLELVRFISKTSKIVFPIHPRTLKKIQEYKLNDEYMQIANLIFVEPLDYFAFQKLIKYSHFVITDSGGVQEETTFVKKPCLTLRANTERPSTVEVGTNTLSPFDLDIIKVHISNIQSGKYKEGSIPKYWDGKSTQRIVEIISKLSLT